MPAKLTVSGLRYQPRESGCRSGAGVTAGAVASYLIATLAAVVLPATSVHEPERAADALSTPA